MKCFLLIIVSIFLIVSCRSEKRSQEVIETEIYPDILSDTGITIEDTAILYEPVGITNPIDSYDAFELEAVFNILGIGGFREAIINDDCDMYERRTREPFGKLLKGQDVKILDYYYSAMREDGNYEIYVEIETIDNAVKGFIQEQYITYLDKIDHNLWCKNIKLIREDYYLESVGYIYNRDFSLYYDKEQSIRMIERYFNEDQLFISEGYLCIGIGDFFNTYRIIFINKIENSYIFHLSGRLRGEEAKIVLLDDDDGIIITHFITKDRNLSWERLFSSSLNTRYIPYNAEKSIILRDNILQWVQENRGS